ncbi:MAG: ATP-binding protein [Synergistaceae bacterium]|nr:ATP-binding protein [Synergistaceae bacterium]
MSEIKALPESIWLRIAAGEVVERPASAVKELVENSLDAGASQIRVKLFDGGRLRIIVEDNGKGIEFQDLPLALQYHATSKINSLEDLEAINTLGYRGEALASLSAAADVEIRSKYKNSDSGGLIRTHDAKIIEHVKINCPYGTRVQIENLFSGLPARRKFLKSASGELRRAAVFLREYSVCHPEIAFTLEHDGKEIFNTDGSGSKKRVLAKIWDNCAEIQNIEVSAGHVKLECWYQARPGRIDIISFVNGRTVSDPVIKSAVNSNARDLMGNFALFFTLEPSLIDVNIHPAKSEVRFRYPAEIYQAVKMAVNNLGSPIIESSFIESKPVINYSFNPAQESRESRVNYSRMPAPPLKIPELNPESQQDSQIFLDDFNLQPEISQPEIIYMGQTSGGYLIYDTSGKIIIMDPHAAHERINYEKIKSLADESKNVQKLLIPVLLHPTLALEANEYNKELQANGFELADTIKGVELRAIPALPDCEFEPETLLRASLGALKNNHDGNPQNILWRTWATMACKASIKLTNKITREEALTLWANLHECKQPFVCPHGRPVMIEISNQDLTKQFGRE